MHILTAVKYVDSSSVNFSNKFRNYNSSLNNFIKGIPDEVFDDDIYVITYSLSEISLETYQIIYEDKNYKIIKIRR